MTHYTELAAPLVGCLYCHTEGTITEHFPKAWQRSKTPRLSCGFCNSVAEFEHNTTGKWRIKYQLCNTDELYYYAHLVFNSAGWLDEDTAIDLSTDAYVQRKRNEQVKAGQLGWLQPKLPDTRPNSITPDEHALVFIEAAHLKRKVTNAEDDSISIHDVDTGGLFFTDRNLHLQGKQRNWTYTYGAVVNVSYSGTAWVIRFSDDHFIEHTATQRELNAQIIVNLVETLRSGDGQLIFNR